MVKQQRPTKVLAIDAASVPPDTGVSGKPEPFRSLYAMREKRRLGKIFGLKTFGVNVTRLPPGGISALLHRHSHQDEFVYVLEGTATLVTDRGEARLSPGMCAGFAAGGLAHQLVNRTGTDVLFLEVGDRTSGDNADFPADDLVAVQGEDGSWTFTHKDGSPY